MIKVSSASLIILFIIFFAVFLFGENGVEPSEERIKLDGEEFLEASNEDWVSYKNPRDRFHPDYHEVGESVPDEVMNKERPGSGKFCMSLLNEANQPVMGETLNNVTAEMHIEGLEWHSLANPFRVNYPLNENYDRRPLDGDQFGSSDNLSQGDGYLDSHCIEFHLEKEDLSLNYSQIDVYGQDSEGVEVVGYRENIGVWDSTIDPVEDVYEYNASELSDGKVSMDEENTHFQVVGVLRLTRNLED